MTKHENNTAIKYYRSFIAPGQAIIPAFHFSNIPIGAEPQSLSKEHSL